jgi:hypothetical protein
MELCFFNLCVGGWANLTLGLEVTIKKKTYAC